MSSPSIWKFTLDPWDPWVQTPSRFKALAVDTQAGKVRLWAEVHPGIEPDVERQLVCAVTGGQVPAGRHLGTCIINEEFAGGLQVVIHVYETGLTRPVRRR